MNGIVLSAGFGTRLKPYTEKTPKPAIPFMSVPLACYPLSLFEREKIHNLVVNTHHLPKQIEALFNDLRWPMQKPPDKLIFSAEPGQILGSGGGIRHAIESLVGRGTFFVANADEVILPFHFSVIKEALEFHQYHGGIATLLCIQHPGVGSKFGGAWLKDGEISRVTGFSKLPMPGHRGLHFVGLLLLSDRIEEYFFQDDSKEENILYDTLTKAMSKGEQVHAMEIEAKWFETGNPQDFLQATEECLQAIQALPPAPWAEYLRQLICRCSTRSYQIENDQPELKAQMVDRLSKLFSGDL